jgi:putative cobalt transporter subunit CbtB
MNDAVATAPIPLRDLVPWVLLAAVLMLLLYVVGLDQGAVSRAGDFMHELTHDGRHLLGLPCH